MSLISSDDPTSSNYIYLFIFAKFHENTSVEYFFVLLALRVDCFRLRFEPLVTSRTCWCHRQPCCRCVDGWMDVWMNGWMKGWMDEGMDGWICRCMYVWMYLWMDGCMDEGMDRWMKGRMDR